MSDLLIGLAHNEEVLDVTDSSLRGQELSDYISTTVNDRNAFLITDVPSVLLVTLEQFVSLAKLEALFNMMGYSQFLDEVSPNEDVKMFYTREETGLRGRQYGGYALEVRVKEEK